MHSHADQARRGFARMDLFGAVRPEFGRYNPRPINQTEVKKLYMGFIQEGILRYDVIHAIPLILSKDDYEATSISTDPTKGKDLPVIEWSEHAITQRKVIAAGGQHRVEALRTWIEAIETQISRENVRRKKLEDDLDDPAIAEEVAKIDNTLREHKRRLTEGGYWMVSVYDEGASSVSPNQHVHYRPATDDVGKYEGLADFLSRNTNIHIYNETPEERLIRSFRTLNAKLKLGSDEYEEALEKARRDAIVSSSKHSAVMHSPIVIEFFGRLLESGEAYHKMSCIKVSWTRDSLIAKHGAVSPGR